MTLGLTTLAALTNFASAREAFWYSVAAAIASYAGAVCWLYEKKRYGQIALVIVALMSIQGSLSIPNKSASTDRAADRYLSPVFDSSLTSEVVAAEYSAITGVLYGVWPPFLLNISKVTSGLLLGLTFAAMLLGHWYLNSPGMQLAPLHRLLSAAALAVVLQAVVSAIGLACEYHYAPSLSIQWVLFLALRWSFGIVGVLGLLWMAWQTLKIPNTQSATGILYVAVIGVFIGELAASLLSAESAFPL
ncbi:MAG: hypothetical protein WD669_01250 [Pirellulales bacterium]